MHPTVNNCSFVVDEFATKDNSFDIPLYSNIVTPKQFLNKIRWQCLVPTSTTRFASDVGYRMAKKWIWLYKEIIFMSNGI